ncbi:MAG: peptidoglycan DD-metalloendopeptidase family protein [Syntrophomonadaceae bacterium]|nr:peptidoglycan DD-metalloendopeptidase family protein [Syntrophomonadaceae bacterium]
MSRRKVLTGLMVLIMLAAMIMPVYADELSEQQQRLNEINQQMNQQQSNLSRATRNEKSIMGQMESIERDAEKTQQEINTLEERINNLTDNIALADQQIKEKQQELDKQIAQLGDRLVAIYEQGDSTYLEVLLGANDVRDFITRLDMITTIIDQDRDLIGLINKAKKELDTKLADLEVQKRELVAAQESQEARKTLLASKLNEKQMVLSSVQNEKEKYAQVIAELEQASAEAEAIVRKKQGNTDGTRIGTGVFTWPAPGYTTITSPFGMRYHPILKVNKLHTGMDIGAPYGAKIVAADGGTVIFAGWLGGYGNATIIDHGASLSTLYGHQSQILVKVGDTVFKGQTIGKVGSTGYSTGPHLHFEVRKNGTPVEPRGYI